MEGTTRGMLTENLTVRSRFQGKFYSRFRKKIESRDFDTHVFTCERRESKMFWLRKMSRDSIFFRKRE
jgi:hypothetical protein